MIHDVYRRDNNVRYDLLMLLVKLNLFPYVLYEGEIYPASQLSQEYKDWYCEYR